MKKVSSFLYYYLRSMRLYYAFVTGSTVLVGVAVNISWDGVPWYTWQCAAIVIIGYFAWGVNQIFNDWSNLAEDRINAPHRPMVTGKLPASPALAVSCVLMLIFIGISYLANPWCLLPLAVGAVFNLLYSFSKRLPILGNLVYGVSITMCLGYGMLGCQAGEILERKSSWALLGLMIPCLLSNTLMCYFSDLKDIAGDCAAKKWTMAVLGGYNAALWIGVVFSLPMLGYYAILSALGCPAAMIGSTWCVALTVYSIWLFAKRKLHAATCANCQACVAQILLFTTLLSPWCLAVMAGSWIAIQLLFLWYPDEKE